MLAIQCYRFLIGTKIPYSEWPQIAQNFLKQHNLQYKRFLYYFEEYTLKGLPKAVKDCPKLGEIRFVANKSVGINYVSNIDCETECTEADIIPLMTKIYRHYGFCKSNIIYQDINFNSKFIPSIIEAPGNKPLCIKGSGITVYRDSVFPRWSSIDLRIIVYDGSETYDPSPYFETMRSLLPGVKTMNFVEYCMTNDEKNMYEVLNKSVVPLIENATEYLNKSMAYENEGTPKVFDTPKFSIASSLKKLCKKHGYTYVKCEYYVYFVKKRTPNGHYIILEINMGPAFKGVDFLIRFEGVGFKHHLGGAFHYPSDQSDLDSYLSNCFNALIAAEKDIFPALDAHFPPSPDWFDPIS